MSVNNKSIGKNAMYNVIYKVLNVIFPLISTAYISRILLSEGVGRISAVSNNVSYFLILASLGSSAYGLREIAKNREKPSARNEIFSELFVINLALTITTYLLFILLVFYNSYFSREKELYVIFGLTILLNALNIDWFFQGVEAYGYIAIRSIIIKFISIVALFVFIKDKNDIYLYAIIQVVAITGNYVLNIINIRKLVKVNFRGIVLRRHLKPLLYLAMCSVSTELYAKMDITMLDMMKSSDVVGYYSNSQKIINLVITTLVAVTAVFMPRLSYLFDCDKKEFNKILRVGFVSMVTISIPACVGIVISSEPLVLSFLGDDFKNASVTVSILSLMIPLKCIGDLICYQVMMCARKESLLMVSYFVTMLVNLVNNLFLIPRYGAEGASVASVISELLVFVLVLGFSKKHFRLNGIKDVIIKTLFCSVIMACSVLPLSFLNISCIFKLVLEGSLGILVYFVSCMIIRHEVVLTCIGIIKRKKGR